MYGQPLSIVVRMLAVLVLVAGTYNPGGYSWYHWVTEPGWNYWIAKLFTLLVLISGYIVCVYATVRSLGLLLGVPFLLVILTGIWFAEDRGWIDLSDWMQRTLVIEGALILLLGTGTSFSIIRYRLAGQMDSRSIT
jgi:hypothetical protein